MTLSLANCPINMRRKYPRNDGCICIHASVVSMIVPYTVSNSASLSAQFNGWTSFASLLVTYISAEVGGSIGVGTVGGLVFGPCDILQCGT